MMKRRDFLKSTFLFAAVSTVVGKATGLISNAIAADVYVTKGKLGYKEVSPQAKNNKFCNNCKHYEAVKGEKDVGICKLPAMKTAMKAPSAPKVLAKAYCNMWAKIS